MKVRGISAERNPGRFDLSGKKPLLKKLVHPKEMCWDTNDANKFIQIYVTGRKNPYIYSFFKFNKDISTIYVHTKYLQLQNIVEILCKVQPHLDLKVLPH